MSAWSHIIRSFRDGLAKLKHKSRGGTEHINLGKLGEDLAVNALKAEGYSITKRNMKVYKREVDVIAKEGGALVFIEVKTRATHLYGKPLEAIDNKRRKRLKKAAELYIVSNKIKDMSVRFDVVSVDYSDVTDPKIEIVRNAF